MTSGDLPISSGLSPDIPQYELDYYADMPDEVKEAVSARVRGWNRFKDSGAQEGMDDLVASVEALQLFLPDIFVIGSNGRPIPEGDLVYVREMFASYSRLAVATAITGDWEEAHWIAMDAYEEKLPAPDKSGVDEDKPDQYRITFDGQLAIVLASFSNSVSSELAKSAMNNYEYSQDLDRIAFPDRQMNPSERANTVSKYRNIAWFATALTAMPAPNSVKNQLAQRILARCVNS
jgi:hypothetical protein